MFGRATCEREAEVLAAARSGRLPDELERHAAGCPACHAQLAVSRALLEIADIDDEPHPLPRPEAIWWKAQLVRRWQAERRVAEPMETMQRFELVAGLVALVGLLVWQGATLWRAVFPAEGGVDPATLTRWTSLLDPSALGVLLPIAAALLGVGALVTVSRFMIAE
jgi:hypothetical protein